MAVRLSYEGRLRQEDLGRKIGVHQSKVSKWATGVMTPSVDEISLIEDACGRSRGFILALTGQVTDAGLAEAREFVAAGRGPQALAAERGGTAALSKVARRARTRPRPGSTPSGRDAS